MSISAVGSTSIPSLAAGSMGSPTVQGQATKAAPAAQSPVKAATAAGTGKCVDHTC